MKLTLKNVNDVKDELSKQPLIDCSAFEDIDTAGAQLLSALVSNGAALINVPDHIEVRLRVLGISH